MGLPVDEVGGRPPGGGGMGLPVVEVGGRCGIGARAAGASAGAAAAGATGAAGASGAAAAGAGAGAGAAGAAGASRRGPLLPDDEMTRLGAAGFGAGAGAGAGTGAGSETGSGAGATVSASATGTSATTGSVSAGATGVSASAVSSAGFFAAAFLAGAFLAAAFLTAAFLAGASGSSGCTSRTRPSRSALRRTRSAWGSTTLEEWLFTPIPSATQRSKVSLLVRPSSRASSYTRMLDGNCYLSDRDSGPTKQSVKWARPAVTRPRNGSLSSHDTASGEEW